MPVFDQETGKLGQVMGSIGKETKETYKKGSPSPTRGAAGGRLLKDFNGDDKMQLISKINRSPSGGLEAVSR
jgi:hypothetical protein